MCNGLGDWCRLIIEINEASPMMRTEASLDFKEIIVATNEGEKKQAVYYMNALQLGGTRTLPELYKAAGLDFNFSESNVKGLMDFVHEELKKLI